jgi:hypothetical protein
VRPIAGSRLAAGAPGLSMAGRRTSGLSRIPLSDISNLVEIIQSKQLIER